MDKMLRACLNWKVIGGLTVVGLGLWFVAPNLLAAAFPVLLLAVCPLSMALMMRGMRGEHGADDKKAARAPDVALSHDLEPTTLRALRDEIDHRIKALESAGPEPTASKRLTENGKQRT